MGAFIQLGVLLPRVSPLPLPPRLALGCSESRCTGDGSRLPCPELLLLGTRGGQERHFRAGPGLDRPQSHTHATHAPLPCLPARAPRGIPGWRRFAC